MYHREFDEDEEVKEPQVAEVKQDDMPPNYRPGMDTISAIQDNEVRQGSEARQAAENALSTNDLTRGEMDARRYASEAAARTTIGDDAVDLDQFSTEHEMGFQGNNYPTYDVASANEIASVKTHWNSDGQADVSAYKQDFSKMLGWGRPAGALEKDGENILKARDAGASVPQELEGATIEEASEYLRDNGCLRIPDDHVDAVRAELEADARKFPSNYHLPENPSEEQINHVLGRVQGVGLTSSELQSMINQRMRRR